jgi:hypothetical protein
MRKTKQRQDYRRPNHRTSKGSPQPSVVHFTAQLCQCFFGRTDVRGRRCDQRVNEYTALAENWSYFRDVPGG